MALPSLAEASAPALPCLGASTPCAAVGGIGAPDPALRAAWRGAAGPGAGAPALDLLGLRGGSED